MTLHPQPSHPDPAFARHVHDRMLQAISCGALHLTRTRQHILQDNSVPFIVHEALEQRNKPKGRRVDGQKRPARDAFATPAPALFVENVSPTHQALLNKYPVLEDHLLIITRTFESQTSQLTIQDFDAVVRIRSRLDTLVFYNGGPTAGASQPRKHIQAIPLPLGEQASPLPLWPHLADDPPKLLPVRSPSWPFRHAAIYLGNPSEITPSMLARATRRALDSLNLTESTGTPHPYNLLLARSWLWVVPRACERVAKVSINALGFAGSFYVKNAKRLEKLRRIGPMNALCTATGAADD